MYIILHTMKHSTEHMAEPTYEHGSSREPEPPDPNPGPEPEYEP